MNFNHSFTKADALKIAIAGAALLVLLVGARLTIGRAHAKQERSQMVKQMNLEMGRGPQGDESQIPESQPGAGDPNFVW